MFFYTKYLKLSSKYSQCRSKAFQNEIKFEILIYLGKVSSSVWISEKLKYVSFFASTAAVVSLLLTSDGKVPAVHIFKTSTSVGSVPVKGVDKIILSNDEFYKEMYACYIEVMDPAIQFVQFNKYQTLDVYSNGIRVLISNEYQVPQRP